MTTITQLMHTVSGREHVAIHASPEWLDHLRHGVPKYELTESGERIEVDRITIDFQCLACSKILHSDDVTDGATYTEPSA